MLVVGPPLDMVVVAVRLFAVPFKQSVCVAPGLTLIPVGHLAEISDGKQTISTGKRMTKLSVLILFTNFR